jgi:hypothetical protein
MKKKQYVKDLKMGDRVESQFLVTGKRYRQDESNLGRRMELGTKGYNSLGCRAKDCRFTTRNAACIKNDFRQ